MGETVAPVIDFQSVLRRPTCGFPSMAQAMAVRMGGMKKGSEISTSSLPRQGVSVRATIQASRIASNREGMVLAVAI